MGKSKYVLIPAYSTHPDNLEKLKKSHSTLNFKIMACSIYCLWVAIRMPSKTAAIHHRSRPPILRWQLVVLSFSPEPGALPWASHRARYAYASQD